MSHPTLVGRERSLIWALCSHPSGTDTHIKLPKERLVMLRSETLQRWLPALGAAIPLTIFPIAVLSLPLAAAQEMRLSEAQTTSWILALYGLLGLVLTIRYRQ